MKQAFVAIILLAPLSLRAQPADNVPPNLTTFGIQAKPGIVEITPLFVTEVGGKFSTHTGGGAAVVVHLSDLVGVEVVASMMGGSYTDLVHEVFDITSLRTDGADMKQMDLFVSIGAQLAPLHGYLDVYGMQASYYVYIAGGLVAVNTLEPCFVNADDCDEPELGEAYGLRRPDQDSFRFGGNIGGGLFVGINGLFGLRLEMRNLMYEDSAVFDGEITSESKKPLLLILGASITL